MKRVFIIHGWEGTPKDGWCPWLKKRLEEKGFEVHVPAMPNPDAPEVKSWLNALKNLIGKPDENTYLVGHSIGCLTILHYLESLPEDAKIGGVLFVAGWFTLTPEATPDEASIAIAKSWVEKPIDFKKILQKTKNMIAIFSDNDPHVPFEENKKRYAKFCRKIIVETKGHFTGDIDKCFELPSALNAVLELAKV
jgi:predicted alpha/beta hydrolase family esterase